MSQQIPVGSVLGGRYEITAHIIITAESDMVLEGTDQILNRKVSVVVASPSRSALLEVNSRALATNARGNIQILDLGITPKAAATSSPPTPTPTPCWTPYWSKTTHSPTQKTRWAPKSSATPKAAAPQHLREGLCFQRQPGEHHRRQELERIRQLSRHRIPEPTSIYEDDEDEDEEDGSRGTWAVALAAVLLLVIVAGGILTSLGAIGSNQAAAPNTPSPLSPPPNQLRQTSAHRHPDR